jgi:hypothetical protein
MKNNYQNIFFLVKKCLLIFLFLSGVYSGYSQVSFGAKSGINIATTKGLIANPKNRLGWFAGGFASIPVNKKFFLQPELHYSSKGHRTIHQDGGDSKSVTRLNYLNMPILAGYKIDYKTSFFFGPEIGYLLSAQMKYSSKFMNVLKNYPPKFDISLAIGVDYTIINNIGIGARYNFGFNTLYSVDAVGNRYSDNKGGNRVFQIGLNYIF